MASAGSSELDFEDAPPALFPASRLGTVLLGTGSAGLLGFTVGSAIGVKQNVALRGPAIATALNSSLVAFTFFSFRQYAVAPAFDAYDAARGRAPLDNRSWLEPTGRLDGALRTAVAGAGTGALIRSLQAGRRVILPAGFTTALTWATLHVALNQILIWRLRFLGSDVPVSSPASLPSSAPSQAPPSAGPAKAATALPQPTSAPASERRRWWHHLMPVHRIPDPERKEMLEKDLADVNLQLQEVERDIAREEEALQRAKEQQPR